MENPALRRATPILLSRDLDETILFYDKLDFRQVARYDDYLILRRDDVDLHFTRWPDLDPKRNSCACYLYVEGIDALYEAWLHVGAVHPNGKINDTAYGMREFAAIDEDLNLLRIGERMGP